MEKKSVFEQEDHFTHLVKKAKRKSLKRSIIVSLIVTVVALFVLWACMYVGQYLMYERLEKQADEAQASFALIGANVYSNGTSFDHFFVASQSKTSAYKKVNGHLIDWDKRSYFHTILGTTGVIQQNNWITVDGNTYANGHKMVAFHLPNEETTKNDLVYLKSLPKFYNVEVAVSFTKELPLSVVSTEFPKAEWLWVIQDGLYKDVVESKKAEKKDPLLKQRDYSEQLGDHVYGFPIDKHNRHEQVFEYSAELYRGLVERIVSEGDENGAAPIKNTFDKYKSNELPIAGVILTGTVADVLAELKDENVRIVRTGIIIPY